MTGRKQRSTAQFPDGAADVARRFGVTIKTLRLYEDAGLITPVRDAHGWRTYGQRQCERLHLILLLRQFGFSVARIAVLLGQGAPEIGDVLSLQQRALSEQRARIDEALGLIERAQGRLAGGERLDAAALAVLAKTAPVRLHWSPALEMLAAKVFTEGQHQRLNQVAPQLQGEWSAIYTELAELVDGPADTPRTRALGARTSALIARMTGGDDGMRAALMRFWHAGFADPALAGTLPMDETRWRFLGAAMAAHARHEVGA